MHEIQTIMTVALCVRRTIDQNPLHRNPLTFLKTGWEGPPARHPRNIFFSFQHPASLQHTLLGVQDGAAESMFKSSPSSPATFSLKTAECTADSLTLLNEITPFTPRPPHPIFLTFPSLRPLFFITHPGTARTAALENGERWGGQCKVGSGTGRRRLLRKNRNGPRSPFLSE